MAAIEKYLRRGWALFPVAARGRTPAILSPHPRDVRCRGRADGCPLDGHGCLDATTDRVWIERWWPPGCRHNIGIATGAPSGFWVLDYDPRHAGEATADLVVRLRREGLSPQVRTGRDGEHWRFALPSDFEVTNRRGTLPPGLDVRGTGGYVVAPPSVSEYGPYVELGDAPPYRSPGWLLDMIRPAAPLPRGEPPAGWSPGPCGDDRGQRYAAAAVADMLAELAATPSNRNDLALSKAYRLVEFINAGWVDGDAAYRAWEAATLAHPLDVRVPQSEVDTLWRNALRHIGDRPAELPPEWTDPLRIREVWPAPPTSAGAVPPFSPSFNGGASAYRVPAFSEPGASNGAAGAGAPPTPASAGTDAPPLSPATSPLPDLSVFADPARLEFEARKILFREAAQRLAREIEGTAGPAAVDAMEAELLDVAGMQALPSLVPLVDGVLFLNSLARLNGPSGEGKSFIALDIGARVTRGLSWAGRATRRGRVIYGVAEGASGFKDRLTAWELTHGPIGELWCLPRPVQALAAEWAVFVEVCRRRAPDLIVIDTQARATEGIDELDRAEMSRLVAAAEALRAATGACVLLVHHTPQRGDDGRGHTEVKGALQSEMLARKSGSKITLKSRKQKDCPDFDPIEFDLVGVPAAPVESLPGFSEPGQRIISAVPVWRGETIATDAPRETVGRVRARALWAVLADPAVQREGLSEVDMRPRMADLCGLAGASMDSIKKAQQRAMAELAALGLVAKRVGLRRFAVVILSDQAADGVLTSNLNVEGLPIVHPDGDWELYMPNVVSEVK